jgi:hypothetical protein
MQYCRRFLVGSTFGLLYLVGTVCLEFWSEGWRYEPASFGILLGLLNIPGAILVASGIVPHTVESSLPWQVLVFAVTDMVIGGVIAALWYRRKPSAIHPQ